MGAERSGITSGLRVDDVIEDGQEGDDGFNSVGVLYLVQSGSKRELRPVGPQDRSAQARAWDENAKEWGSLGLGRAAMLGIQGKRKTRRKY